jgi:hypothetical protein
MHTVPETAFQTGWEVAGTGEGAAVVPAHTEVATHVQHPCDGWIAGVAPTRQKYRWHDPPYRGRSVVAVGGSEPGELRRGRQEHSTRVGHRRCKPLWDEVNHVEFLARVLAQLQCPLLVHYQETLHNAVDDHPR